MDQTLAGKTIAFMVASGFEETEFTEAQRALLKAGAMLRVLSTDLGLVNGWHGKGWGHYFPVDKAISEALGADYDMLVLPGGERSIAKLSQSAHTRRIVGHFLDAGKPVAAMGHGIQLLAVPGKMRGLKVAAPESLHEAVTAAGGQVVPDSSLVEDRAIVTSSDLDTLPDCIAALLRVFAEAGSLKNAA